MFWRVSLWESPLSPPLAHLCQGPFESIRRGKTWKRLIWDIDIADGSREKEKKGLKSSLNFEGPFLRGKGHVEKIPYIAVPTHLS